MESRLPLLKELEANDDPAVAQFAKDQAIRLKHEVASERKWETELDRDKDERFE